MEKLNFIPFQDSAGLNGLEEDIKPANQLKHGSRVIAIYLDALQGYGADKVLLKIANGLANRGLHVDLVLSKLSPEGLSSIHPAIRVVHLNGSRYTLVKNITALANYLKRRQPHVLFSSIHFNNITASFALALSGIQCKLVLRQANTLQEQFKDYPAPVSRLLHSLTKLAYKRANVVVGQCQGMVPDLTDFMKVSEDKIQLIYNPTVTSDIIEKARVSVNHKWLDANRSYPVILTAGRLKPQKDFETLIKAFYKLQRQYLPDAKLIILGEGPLRSKLESLANTLGVSESIDFVGFHSNPYALMANSDVYVSSSRYEGLPNTLIEALFLGKKIVATACKGGTAEILKYGKYGKLVPVGSPDVMARGIYEMILAPNPTQPDATDDFDHEAQVGKYYGLFLKVLGDSSPHETYSDSPQKVAQTASN